MFKRTKIFLGWMALAATVVSASGCFLLLGAAAGVGGYAWVNGDLEKEYEESVEKLHDASVKALEKLDILVTEDKVDHLTSLVKGKFADGKGITITITAVTEKVAKLRIRVGVFGDEAKSNLIASKIERYL